MLKGKVEKGHFCIPMRGNSLVTDLMFQGIISGALTIIMVKEPNLQGNIGIQVYKLRYIKNKKPKVVYISLLTSPNAFTPCWLRGYYLGEKRRR